MSVMSMCSAQKSEVAANLLNLEIAPLVLHVPLPNMVLRKALTPSAMTVRLKSHQVLRARVGAIMTFLSFVSRHVAQMMTMMTMMISKNGGFHLNLTSM